MFELDKDLPVDQASSMEQVYFDQFAEPRFESQLMAGLAGLALVLAGIGIYSVNAYAVSQRGSEIALRLALGASSRDILSNILAQGLRLALAGILAGVIGAFAAGKLLTSALVGIGAQDPLTLAELPRFWCSFPWLPATSRPAERFESIRVRLSVRISAAATWGGQSCLRAGLQTGLS